MRGAKAELTHFFTSLKNEKTTFLQALQKIATLHWTLHSSALNTKRWFDLSKVCHENKPSQARPSKGDDDKSPRGNKADDSKSNAPRAQEPNVSMHDETHGRKPLDTAPFKWTNPGQVPGLCPTCNMAHLTKQTLCKFRDPVTYKDRANHENVPWKESTVGKRFRKEGYYSAMEKPPSWHKERISKMVSYSLTDRRER